MRDDGKKDMVESEFTPISTEDGESLAEEISAKKFIETSAKTSKNLQELFQQAIEIALDFKYGNSESESKPEPEPVPVQPVDNKESNSKGSKKKDSKPKKKKWWNR